MLTDPPVCVVVANFIVVYARWWVLGMTTHTRVESSNATQPPAVEYDRSEIKWSGEYREVGTLCCQEVGVGRSAAFLRHLERLKKSNGIHLSIGFSK